MVDLVKNCLLATFLLCTLWKSSESYNVVPIYEVLHNNRTLERFRRQLTQTCNGDLSKFKCATTHDCIDGDLQCNGIQDCTDGSDEKESLCKNIPCPKHMFQCDYGACIDSDNRCNGVKDCNDNSDETNCEVSNHINTNCRSDQFECANGQCIEIDQKCNGKAECKDKSDETEELCFNVFCPGHTFKCKYGACVNREAECNNIQDCIDNSDKDEKKCGPTTTTTSSPLPSGGYGCPKHMFQCDYGACIDSDNRCNGVKDCNDNSDETNCEVSNHINTNCRSDQFECANGQCIEVDGKCNGKAECKDKSDETEELCFNVFCPGHTFKCKYGACVNREAECNNIQDCIDNSDEDEKKCGSTTTTTTTTTTLSPLPSGSYGKDCTTPAHPINGQWIYLNNGKKGAFNRRIYSSTVIIYSCDNGYKLSVTTEATLPVVCLPTGDWSLRVVPTCQKLCPSLYNSPLTTLTCMNDGSLVPCDKATDNTMLTYKCAPYYEPPHGQKKTITCYDGSWDYTPECIPVCGEKRVSATPLIVNGQAVERGTYPWSVAIYSNMNSTQLIYKNICGGSIIKTNIVLTAAHCVANERGVGYDAKYFQVGAGKYFNSYRDTRDNDTAQYAEVIEIAVHRKFKGDFRSFEGDIALLKLKNHFALCKLVQPVCYNNLPPLEVNSIGVVTGWGYTTTTDTPSDVLKELEMPYNDEETCLNSLDPDFTLKYFTDDKICAGFNDRNASVCKGDSGGGLAFKSSSHPKRYFVRGIVSIGNSFFLNNQVHCNVQRSALFTKVEDYITWIHLKVRQWNPNERKD